jgi:hypothetical protein
MHPDCVLGTIAAYLRPDRLEDVHRHRDSPCFVTRNRLNDLKQMITEGQRRLFETSATDYIHAVCRTYTYT